MSSSEEIKPVAIIKIYLPEGIGQTAIRKFSKIRNLATWWKV